jgi:hypothetical protein
MFLLFLYPIPSVTPKAQFPASAIISINSFHNQSHLISIENTYHGKGLLPIRNDTSYPNLFIVVVGAIAWGTWVGKSSVRLDGIVGNAPALNQSQFCVRETIQHLLEERWRVRRRSLVKRHRAHVKITPKMPIVIVKTPMMRLILLFIERSRRRNIAGSSER